jgi:lysophospholipase L1-like esterase
VRLSLSKYLLAVIFLASAPFAVSAQECPDIRGIVDLNCDRKLQITFVGDSIVTGYGDTENRNRGGYVLRLQNKFPEVTFKSVAVNGLKTGGLLELLNNAFNTTTSPVTLEILNTSDVVIIDMGRNDRLVPKPVKDTYKALQLASNKIRRGVKRFTGVEPLVITSVMMVPGRPIIAPFVKKLNTIILEGSSPDHPADLRFDKVGTALLSKDKLHPSSEGYEALFKVAEKYLINELPLETKRLRSLEAPIPSPKP